MAAIAKYICDLDVKLHPLKSKSSDFLCVANLHVSINYAKMSFVQVTGSSDSVLLVCLIRFFCSPSFA